MSFNWPEYLDLAQELVEQAKKNSYQEVKVRAAIGRAYYAAFNMARQHLRSKGMDIRNPVDEQGHHMTVHKYVSETFKNSSDVRRREIGLNLERMSKNRNAADYHLNDSLFNNPDFICKATLKWAKEVLSELKKLS